MSREQYIGKIQILPCHDMVNWFWKNFWQCLSLIKMHGVTLKLSNSILISSNLLHKDEVQHWSDGVCFRGGAPWQPFAHRFQSKVMKSIYCEMLVTYVTEVQITSMASDYHLYTFLCTCCVMYNKELGCHETKKLSFFCVYFVPRILCPVFCLRYHVVTKYDVTYYFFYTTSKRCFPAHLWC